MYIAIINRIHIGPFEDHQSVIRFLRDRGYCHPRRGDLGLSGFYEWWTKGWDLKDNAYVVKLVPQQALVP